ncbi:hypothetical protein O1L68_21295 [Streptomyces lydicus]|nr:hypothetical protein [Streptomyces lydicus]
MGGGRAQYLGGHPERALELLAEAEQLLAATDGVRLRLQLARARALLALAAGPPDEADALLARARQAAALVDTPSTRTWLAVLETAAALRHHRPAAAAEHALAIDPDAAGLTPSTVPARCSTSPAPTARTAARGRGGRLQGGRRGLRARRRLPAGAGELAGAELRRPYGRGA